MNLQAKKLKLPFEKENYAPGIDEPLVMERNNKNYYYHFDGLGSVTQITDTSGNLVNSYTYDSFGNIMQKSENVENFYTYLTQEPLGHLI